LANQLRAAGLRAHVLVVARDSEDDRAFAESLNLGLKDSKPSSWWPPSSASLAKPDLRCKS
jgi:hypothetical protein